MPRGKPTVEFVESHEELEGDSSAEFPPPPPPESTPEIEPDPPANRSGKPSKTPAARVTAAVRKEIAEVLDLAVDSPFELWAIRDPHCGGRAMEQAEKIKAALLKIICKRPSWVAVLTDAGSSADWFALFMAAAPIGTAVYAHHVAHALDEGPTGLEGIDLAAYGVPQG